MAMTFNLIANKAAGLESCLIIVYSSSAPKNGSVE